MRIESIEAAALSIPFRSSFRHASAQRSTTEALWVTVRTHDGAIGYGEGCPRAYVTNETVAGARAFVDAHRSDWLRAVRDTGTLCGWAASHEAEIDENPAAWTAVELALLDAIGKEEKRSVEALLGLPELAGRFVYTAVLGDASPARFEEQLTASRTAGLRSFKIKLSGDRARDLAKVRSLSLAGIAPEAARADANNLWRHSSTSIAHLRKLGYPFFAVEEPLRAGELAGLRHVASALQTRIVLDESVLRPAHLDEVQSDRFIVNLRVSKMGGILRTLAVARAARSRGLELIVGAHVGETSVLARAALTVANACREGLLAQEGAIGTRLLARDPVEPSITFGAGGELDVSALGIAGAPGLGLRCFADALAPQSRPRT
jgi:L-alanine-DL-glutamate epimerase-like enolase superfamily enzyme